METTDIIWQGPYSWPKYEAQSNLKSIPDIAGVYLFTFSYKDGFLLYAAGITNSTRQRFLRHTREYKKGNYNALAMDFAERGERKEIWHGWQYAKAHQHEFNSRKESILKSVDEQLHSFRIFAADVTDKRKRERIEAALMQAIYLSEETWSLLADRGMSLKGRNKTETPVIIQNVISVSVYGLPGILEI
jgi:hypothetical protein